MLEREEAALLCEKRPQDKSSPETVSGSVSPGRLMRSFSATRASFYYPTRIHPALNSFADECCGMLARLVAYVGTLALLAILGIHLWDQLPEVVAGEPAAKPGWSVATRSHPAFAVSQFNFPGKKEAFEKL